MQYKRQHAFCRENSPAAKVSNPFFLTRQTANLMEDFTRALAEGGTLFLLYGEPGIGKTRLLRELRDSRMEAGRVHWIDMRGVSDGQIVQVDRSNRIEEVFSVAEAGDTIVVDHFEIALKKSRHQLFVSWAETGQEKKLNLVIACASEGFNELRQLSQQYQVQMQSFELMPLANDEVEALLGFHLFPDHPIGRLDIPPPLRRRLAATRGVISRVLEIADEDGSHIRISAVADAEPRGLGSRLLISVLVLAGLAGAIGWYLLSRPAPMLTTPSPVVEKPAPQPAPEPRVEPEPAATLAETEPAAGEPAPGASDERETDAAEASGPGTETVEIAADDSPGGQDESAQNDPTLPAADEAPAAALSETELAVEPGDAGASDDLNAADETAPLTGETGTVSDSEAVLVETEIEIEAAASATEATSSRVEVPAADDWNGRFQVQVKRSLDWLFAQPNEVGTVQILLLTYDSFDPQAYFGYIDELVARGIDPEQLHIFKTLTGGREVYSVFYGEFPTRQQAYTTIPELPEALRELDPIARSVGGIWTEIRRLEGQN